MGVRRVAVISGGFACLNAVRKAGCYMLSYSAELQHIPDVDEEKETTQSLKVTNGNVDARVEANEKKRFDVWQILQRTAGAGYQRAGQEGV